MVEATEKIIRTERLDIVRTYPVKWSKYKVFMDFIQNFYDAAGWENFYEEVTFKYNEDFETLEISSNEIFDYEWLKYVGVSSKRDSSSDNIGRFGEGFKVAALVAVRDFGYTVTMESDNWKFNVGFAEDKVDDMLVEFMAYKFIEREKKHTSVLTLQGISVADMENVEKAKNSFFYRQNEEFGEAIFEDGGYAIYLSNGNGNGIYAHRLKRANLYSDIKLYFRNDAFLSADDTRERNDFSTRIATECILEIVHRLDGHSALILLEKLEQVWSKTKRKYEGVNWCEIISLLIDIIRINTVVKEKFLQKYKDELIIGFPENYYNYNRKKIATTWFRQSIHYKRRIVIDDFKLLGIDSIEAICEQENGFVVSRKPCEQELDYIQILDNCINEVFKNLICYKEFPEIEIVISAAAFVGLAQQFKIKARSSVNAYGMRPSFRIKKILLKEYLFKKTNFSVALTTYMHELLHQFGGDSSCCFRKGLMTMNSIIIEKHDVINKYKLEWENLLS